MGISNGLEIATRALRAQQLAVDVTAHNIANVATPGFSRQELRFEADAVRGTGRTTRNPLFAQVGTGVIASDLRRIRDLFIDLQVRQVTEGQGRFLARAEGMQRLETVFNEPSDDGLNALFGKFWNAWDDLSNQPESTATRAAVVENAQTLTSALKRAEGQLRVQRDQTNRNVEVVVSEVNSIGTQLASLNEQISRLDVGGNAALDLKDQRDLLLDKLSKLVGVSYTDQIDGTTTVYMGSQIFVQGNTASLLSTSPNAANGGFFGVRFGDGTMGSNFGGRLEGLMEMRDTTLASKLQNLNAFAVDFMTRVNLVHRDGRGLTDPMPPPSQPMLNFFAGTDIGSMSVEPALVADPRKVRAAVNYTITSVVPTASVNVTPSGQPHDLRPGTITITDDGAGNVTIQFTPDIFNPAPPPPFIPGAPEPAYVGTLAPGEVNTTLIPGVTLTGPPAFGAAGAASIVITAAPAASGAGDGSNAINIAELRPIFDDAYQRFVTEIGIEVQESESLANNQDALVEHLEVLRQSVMGVNMDEELVNLVKFQHAYDAAARLMSVVDEMLDRLINRTGIVGL